MASLHCVNWCFTRTCLCAKLLSHWSHLNGLCPLCILWCIARAPFSLNPLPHWSHLNGLSPLCVLWCITRIVFCVKPLWHWSHLSGFSPLCFLMFYKGTLFSKTFITPITFKWLLPTLCVLGVLIHAYKLLILS